MAETVKPTVAPATFTFNEQAVKDKFAKIEDNVNKQAGKAGYNPYVWLNKFVNPFIDCYIKEEGTHQRIARCYPCFG